MEPVHLPGLAALEAGIEGRVVHDPGDELVRKPAWAQFADIRPQAIVLCSTPEDVAEATTYTRRVGAETVARSGGHCFAGRSSTRGILIDLSEMCSVSVDDGVATVQAGALLGRVYEQLEAHGVTIAAGACPSVGIGGLTLGGGLGILGRRYGLTSDQLLAAQVVLADGRLVECDRHRDAGLFWALRGAGGGQFGIVSGFRFKTVPADDLTCYKLTWPHAQAVAAVTAWQDWAPDAPDRLAASLLLNTFGDHEEPVVTLFGAMLGTETDAADTLGQLIARLGDPTSTTLESMAHGAAKRFLAEHAPGAELGDAASQAEPVRPPLMISKSEFFRRSLPSDAIAALVDAFARGREGGEARELDFTPWSGAYNRTPADATAFVHRHERFLLKHAVVLDAAASPGEQAAAREWLAGSWSLVHPYGSGGVFPNFPDSTLPDWQRAYHGTNYERLTRLKARYDPGNVFRFHQSIPPARGSTA
jgi:FAD/FMN-containing dehydrogenase